MPTARKASGKHQCVECNKCFSSKASLDAHCVKVHGHPAIVCPICQKTFPDRNNMNRHKRIIHTHSKTFWCNKCDRDVGARKDNAKRHAKQSGCNFEVDVVLQIENTNTNTNDDNEEEEEAPQPQQEMVADNTTDFSFAAPVVAPVPAGQYMNHVAATTGPFDGSMNTMGYNTALSWNAPMQFDNNNENTMVAGYPAGYNYGGYAPANYQATQYQPADSYANQYELQQQQQQVEEEPVMRHDFLAEAGFLDLDYFNNNYLSPPTQQPFAIDQQVPGTQAFTDTHNVGADLQDDFGYFQLLDDYVLPEMLMDDAASAPAHPLTFAAPVVDNVNQAVPAPVTFDHNNANFVAGTDTNTNINTNTGIIDPQLVGHGLAFLPANQCLPTIPNTRGWSGL